MTLPLITNLADRMYALDQGRIIVEGTPDEVINHPLVIESYLGAEGYADLVGPNGGRGSRRSTVRRRRAATAP